MKKGILQFVLLKPIFALLTLILARTKNYEHSEISMTSTYLWVSLFYNLSVSWSMYCLLVLFFASKDILAHYRPLPKFLCIKFTLMFTFYQELLLSMLIPILHLYPDHVEPSHFAHALQSGLLCIEMSMCASLYQAAFNYMDYPPSPRLYVMDALRDAMGIKDVIIDIQRTWKGTKEHWSKADHVLAHLDTHRRTQLERLLLRFGVYRRFRSLTIDETQPLFIDSDRPYIEQEEVEPSETDFLEIDEEVDEEDDEKYETAVQDYGYRVIDDGGGQLENRREEFPRQWSHPYLI
ncbi:hypothetical protein HMI54_010248 [Coelomomyces lativittatus]|nr:hypothetical protein HMI54_010248 [Coelomomyces lativittatus]